MTHDHELNRVSPALDAFRDRLAEELVRVARKDTAGAPRRLARLVRLPLPPRFRRVVVAALAVVALGAGIAVAETTSGDYPKVITVTEQNGETHRGILCGELVHGENDIPKVVEGLTPEQCRRAIENRGQGSDQADRQAAIPAGDREHLVSMEAAQSRVGFQILLPGSLPDGYELAGAVALGASQVRVHFAGPNGEIILVESPNKDSRPKPQGFEFATSVAGYPALGIKGEVPPGSTGPVSQIQWWTGDMFFDLYGPVSYTEIERTAASMPQTSG